MKETLYKIEDKTIDAINILKEGELQLDPEIEKIVKEEFYKKITEIAELVNIILETNK